MQLVGQVLHSDGSFATAVITSSQEYHTVACFKSKRQGVDHHSYEVGRWDLIRDWYDRFVWLGIEIFWRLERHGQGNNLSVFIKDPNDNCIEIPAELGMIFDRNIVEWLRATRTLNNWGSALMRS